MNMNNNPFNMINKQFNPNSNQFFRNNNNNQIINLKNKFQISKLNKFNDIWPKFQ